MKKLLLLLLVLLVLVKVPEAGETWPSPFTWTGGGVVSNIIVDSNLTTITFTLCYNGNCGNIQMAYNPSLNGPYLTLDPGRIYADRAHLDTLWMNYGGVIHTANGNTIKTFGGDGIDIDGSGNLYAKLGTSIDFGEIAARAVRHFELDTASSFTVANLFKVATATPDSAVATLDYAKWSIGNKKLSPAAPSDQWIMTFDAGKDSAIWKANPGAGSGDDLFLDTNGLTAAGVWDVPTGVVLRFLGATITQTAIDTADISLAAVNSIELDGDTVDASGTFNMNASLVDSMRLADADTVRADLYLYVGNESSPNTPLTLTNADMTGIQNITGDRVGTTSGVDLAIRVSTMGIDANPAVATATSDMYLQSNDKIYLGNSITPTAFYIDYDTLAGTGRITKGWKFLSADSCQIGSTWYRGGDVAHSIASKKNVSDSLLNYVAKVDENFKDQGHDSVIAHIIYFGGQPDTVIKITGTLNGSDTGKIYTQGILELSGGTGGSNLFVGLTYFWNGLNLADTCSLNNAIHVEADTLITNTMLRLNGTVTTTSYIGFKAPASPTTTVFTVPNSDYTGGDSYGVMVTNKSGALSFVGSSVFGSGGGGSGSALYMTDSSTAHQLDSAIVKAGSGISLSMTQIDPEGLDTLRIAVSNLTSSNFLHTDSIATNKEINDSLLARFLNWQPWRSTRLGVTYGTGNGRDSLYFLSATDSRSLDIITTHSGPDSVSLLGPSAGGLVIGRPGTTVMDGDSILFTKPIMRFGTTWATTLRTDTLFWDSMITAKGRFSGSVAGGDITAIGSDTLGAAFNDGTANGQWIGLGPTSGRLEFAANGAGTDDDGVTIPTGRLMIGATDELYDFNVARYSVGGNIVSGMFQNYDTASDGHVLLRLWSSVGTSLPATYTGGSAIISIGAAPGFGTGTHWLFGVHRPDSGKFKFSRSMSGDWSSMTPGTAGDTLTNFYIDTMGNVVVRRNIYKQNSITGVRYVDDSALATIGYVKKRIPYYLNATDVVWNYPTAAADTSMHCTFPYVSTYDTTYLAKVSTSTGVDTAFGFVIPFYIQDSVTIDSFIIWALTSSATADSSKIDSVHFTSEHADSSITNALTSNTTDRVGTTLTRYAMVLSRSATPGEIVRARIVCVLKQDESYVTIRKAQIKGTKRS